MKTLREYTRWIDIFSMPENGTDIAKEIAISVGCEVLRYGKPGMCCYCGYRLKGTPEQIKQTEAKWREAGMKVHNRKPRGAFNI